MAPNTAQFLSGNRIVVVGAGIAGLTFVAALHQLWDPSLDPPELTVLEERSRELSLQQDPYVLTVNGGNRDEGLVALQQLGLLGEIRQHASLNNGVVRVWSVDWKQLATIEPEPYGTLPAAMMRVSRRDLKRILLEKAEKAAATWHWGCSCTTAEQLPDGQIRVTTVNATTRTTFTQDCDMLIAADGADSKIREKLRPLDGKLQYAGATQIGGISRIHGGLPHPVHGDYGLQMSSGDGVCCIYTPFDHDTVGWALSRTGPERDAKVGPFEPHELEALKEEAWTTGAMFDEPFRSIVGATDPTTAFIRPAKERPAIAHGSRLRGVVFLGDANHVLNSFVLDGANLALKDGWDLAEQICRNVSLEAAIASYDKLSVPRAEHLLK
ncbi:hypothetical protein BDW59DRAFT_157857 [Aspergillus cavernicola]|uniref:FAD-binding domain-containing protein n=1 Tax=Aspergillus cavernicola TaxID=176166 RepID=A0ABR4IUI6_9EURO